MNLDNHAYLQERISLALGARADLIDVQHYAALRLFNGFYEGFPELVVDLYASTLVLYNYAKHPESAGNFLDNVQAYLLEKLPWVTCVIQKERASRNVTRRRGNILFGRLPAEQIQEFGVWYAVDLLINQDASFYLDTRNLRKWLLKNANGCTVLNTFAYTGSLGVAALAGGAESVIQVDRKRKFLSLARTSGMLNRLDIGKMKLQADDFFNQIARLKREGALFDCVILDPPFFSTTKKGTVNLANESVRLINKVRPLVKDGGKLLVINNALFLNGGMYMRSLEDLCHDGYLVIDELIPAPMDVTGYPDTIINQPPMDTKPFNHPTKITILGVKHK